MKNTIPSNILTSAVDSKDQQHLGLEGVDDPYPTITIIDNDQKPLTKKQRTAFGCLPERTVVIAIFSIYFFFGIVKTASCVSEFILTKPLTSQLFVILTGMVSFLIATAGAIGMNALYKENAVLLRRLSIFFVVLTGFILVLTSIGLIIEMTMRNDLLKECTNRYKIDYDDDDQIDCNRVADLLLIKEALSLLFFDLILIYFVHVIFRHAHAMKSPSRYPYPLGKPESDLPPAYHIYVSQGVPTADNWVPPAYNENPNSIPVGDEKNGRDPTNRV
ncbi:hypothetical protein G9A89_023212 [Geosiphon pyriformis]|nr:hypothetical protein G9A89_023212 [Geosiphon pyriformis]